MFELNKMGLIEEGDDAGFMVKILDDKNDTGGFLVLISEDFNTPEATGYDYWVPDEKAILGFIEESNWKINWL